MFARHSVLLLAALPTLASAQQTEAAKLVPPWTANGYSSFMAGGTVAISGDWAFSGAIGARPKGGMFIYQRQPTGWSFRQSLRGEEVSSWYPSSMAADGTTLAVGAFNATASDGHKVGKVYVYELEGQKWQLTQELQPPSLRLGSGFGVSVAIDGEHMVVGAPGVHVPIPGTPTPNSAGAVFVFEREGGQWQLEDTLLYPGDSTLYWEWGRPLGISVDISGDVIVAGAPVDKGGAVVFARSKTGWHRAALLQAPTPKVGARFGHSVAVSGRTVVAGEDGEGTPQQGSAYVFEKDIQSPGEWSLVQELEASDGSLDSFGYSVDIDGDRIVVGAYHGDFNGLSTGTAYLFLREPSGAWPKTENERFVASDPVAKFGNLGECVAIDGSNVVAGAFSAWEGNEKPGAAYLFEVELGDSFCNAKPNSAGKPARLAITGSETVADEAITLSVRDCPRQVPGMFLMAPGADQGISDPLGDGLLCLGWRGVTRLRLPVSTGTGGAAIHDLEFDDFISEQLQSGTTWSFQFVYRDPVGGPAGFNLTNAVAITLQ